MLPEYANPLFITLEIDENGGTLQMCHGKAICGHVEHSTYYEMSDTGLVNVTERHYHGNVWEKDAPPSQSGAHGHGLCAPDGVGGLSAFSRRS